MISRSEFANRRKQLMRQVGPTGIVILPAAPVAYRNADMEHPYRQQSDFYYLTGFEEPEAVAILIPNRKAGEFVLFNRAKDRDREIWEGHRAGQIGACKYFGANQAFPIDELEKKLPDLLENREQIYYALGLNKSFDHVLLRNSNYIRNKNIINITSTLHEMRLIKSPAEITLMRKAATISAEAHIKAMQICKPGMNEYQLDAEINYTFQRLGARYAAYTSIVGSGENSCILHYNSNNKIIANNSMVLIDAGAEYQYYASDVTRTFPANGRFSPEQKAIYEIVLAAQLAGIKTIRPGASWSGAQEIIIKIITKGLIDIGILKGKLENLIEKQAYTPFYMHRSGHWLGLDTHDVGCYKINNKWRKLEPGMVLTVEPGIYISADIPGVPARWHNIGVRIEDDILVTSTGNEVLSAKAPKTIPDIERIMRG